LRIRKAFLRKIHVYLIHGLSWSRVVCGGGSLMRLHSMPIRSMALLSNILLVTNKHVLHSKTTQFFQVIRTHCRTVWSNEIQINSKTLCCYPIYLHIENHVLFIMCA